MSNHAMDSLVGLGGTEMNKIPFCLQVALFLVEEQRHIKRSCRKGVSVRVFV